MGTTLAPAWAFAAEALDASRDTHLPAGLHVRALPSPRLGVPATPLVVSRALLDAGAVKQLAHSGGVAWVDSQGSARTLPFTVTPGNPVYGYFPQAEAILAQLAATPLAGAFRFEALGSTVAGPVAVQSRSATPYVIAAWTIPMVRVVGSGTVTGITWLDTTAVGALKETFWEVWSLPVQAASRYVPTPDAMAEAKARVERGGAKRQPLYIAYTAPSAGTAPPANPGDAMARIGQVAGQVDRWLDILLNNLGLPTSELVDTQLIQGQQGSLSVPIEAALIGGSIDPDMGHWLGFGDVDQETNANGGALAFYRVRGLWRWRIGQWHPQEAPFFGSDALADPAAAVKAWPELVALGLVPKQQGPFMDLHTWAVALVRLPPDRPPPVSFDAADNQGWLATPPPPEVRRALGLRAGGFRPRAVAALMATDQHGVRTLHSFPGGGRLVFGQPPPAGTPLPLLVARPSNALAAGEASFQDRDAPQGTVKYRLAPGDWFGRWGDWSTRIAPPAARTPPMRPIIEIFTQPPAYGLPVPNGLLSGSIMLRIVVPRAADLPAGGAALSRLDLVETFDGSPPVTVPYLLPNPAAASLQIDAVTGQTLLVIPRTGPALPRCGSRKVRYTARWVDTLAHVSAKADPAVRTMVDPRPPVAPVVETQLRYTARPDAEGNARVDLDFASVTDTRYRVFASTETLLLKALDSGGKPGAAAAAAAIRAAVPGAPRAGAFKAHRARFGWGDFENLTKQPIVAAGAVTRFVHRVSGSLDVLAIYRVLAEGPSGQLSDMVEAELMPFAGPNLGGPARPQAVLVNAGFDPTTQGVRLRVKVPPGRAAPQAWRLRRASVPVADPLRMGIVAQGLVTGATVDTEGTSFELDATEPLTPWRQVRFAVEVQAAKPPGAPTVGVAMPGEWSEASAAVAVAVYPPDEPAPPSAVAAAAAGGALLVTVTHPAADSLIGTTFGPHRFEVWRGVPGARPVLRELAFRRGAGPTWVATDPGPVLAGTFVSVRVIDPIGRRSAAAVSNLI